MIIVSTSWDYEQMHTIKDRGNSDSFQSFLKVIHMYSIDPNN